MSDTTELCINRANLAELIVHMAECDAAFVPPLSDRVDLSAYAQKLVDKALRFEAWHGSEFVGLVAAYCNDPEKRTAFITSVSVLPKWQGRGIANRLIVRCLGYAYQLGFGRIELEVDQHNHPAINLYNKFGFVTDRPNGLSLSMTMALGK